MSSTTLLRRSVSALRAATWTNTAPPTVFHGAKTAIASFGHEAEKRHSHILSWPGNTSRDFLTPRTQGSTSVANVSRIFIKDIKDFETYKTTRFEGDQHYEKVRNQNFGPVSLEESDISVGIYGVDSREFARRDYLQFNGIPYSKLPIAFVTARHNNTFINISGHDHKAAYANESCGKVGFKHSSGKTLHAAEMVGKQAAERALLKGSPEHIRVKVKGPGYGRAAAIRGLALGGLKIVSISDVTPLHVDGLPQRPRKIRRV